MIPPEILGYLYIVLFIYLNNFESSKYLLKEKNASIFEPSTTHKRMNLLYNNLAVIQLRSHLSNFSGL
jgi:uncharacterized membrane protein YobD (UPF0266 family)